MTLNSGLLGREVPGCGGGVGSLADLLGRLGRDVEAMAAYEKAIDRTNNTAERDYMRRNYQTLTKHRAV